MPPCISANSTNPSSQGMHFNFTMFGLSLYRTASTKLVHVGPTGYFLCFSLLLGELSCLEETDGGLRPCRSMRLDGKDQRHIFSRRDNCLYALGRGPRRRQLPIGKLGVPGNLLASGS